MRKKVVVLGSTGSLGVKTLELLEKHKKHFEIIGLSSNKNADLLNKQTRKFQVEKTLLTNGKTHALEDFAAMPEADIVVNVLSGTAGIRPSIAALTSQKILLLGNKESLVAEGKKIMKLARKALLIPLDSEHNAIYEILQKFPHEKIRRIFLPCSGGPFWNKTKNQLKNVTIQEALKHPKWTMGAKVSIESATLLNKGMEILEAHYLFQLSLGKIKTFIQPECKIHGVVEFENKTVAYVSEPEMKSHIENGLMRCLDCNFTSKKIKMLKSFEFTEAKSPILTGIEIVLATFKKNPTAMAKFLRKEEAVIQKFLNGEIKFLKILEELKKL